MDSGASGAEYLLFSDGAWQKTIRKVPAEMALSLFVNTMEVVTILCTPDKLNCLVIGYLFNEGIINGLNDVASMRVCEDESLADIKLQRNEFSLPRQRILTSGCGGGISFTNIEKTKVISDIKISPPQISALITRLIDNAELYKTTGGIHASAICNVQDIIAISEDIGRHNTIDKISGECLLRKIPTQGNIILTTGRLSSEMLRKAAKMQVPVVASLTSPTYRAVSLAKDLGITLIGYARKNRFLVYSCPERLTK